RRSEPRGLGATQQPPLQPSAFSSIQLRGSARRRLGVDSGGPRPMVAGAPAPNRPAIHADASRDFHGRHPLSEEGDGAMSTTRKRDRGSRWAQWCPSCIQDRTLLMQGSTPLVIGTRNAQLRNNCETKPNAATRHTPTTPPLVFERTVDETTNPAHRGRDGYTMMKFARFGIVTLG